MLAHPQQLGDDPRRAQRQPVLRVVLIGRDELTQRLDLLRRAGVLPGEHGPDRRAVGSDGTGDRTLRGETDRRDLLRVDARRADGPAAGLHRPGDQQRRILFDPARSRIGGTVVAVVAGHRVAAQVEDHAPGAGRADVDSGQVLRHVSPLRG